MAYASVTPTRQLCNSATLQPYNSRTLKLFFPIGSFYPAQIGGPDNIMYWHAKALHQRGHTVWVATTDDGIGPDVPLDRWLDRDCGRVIYVKTAVHYAPRKLLLRSLGPLWNCDVVHFSAIFYPISWLLAPLAILLGKKIVWTPHGELDPDALIYSPARKRPILRLVRLFQKRVLFHSTCDAETEYVKTSFGADTRIVQLPYFMELPAQLPRTPGNFWLYVGRIHPKKAIERLIEALPLVRVKKALKIVGDDNSDYGRGLHELANRLNLNEQVEFVGHKRGDEKYQLMADADCLIMPSHTENFGIVVTEALTQQTPAIASTGTPWQILHDRNVGDWVDNTPAAIAQAMNRIADLSPADYEILRQNAGKLVREEFDIAPNIHRWETVYASLMK